MTTNELQAALATHETQQKIERDRKREEASGIRTEAKQLAEKHVGEAMEAQRQRIVDNAEVQALAKEAEADRHDLRAKAAKKGKFLWGQEEWSGPENMHPTHQAMVAAASRYGVLVHDASQI